MGIISKHRLSETVIVCQMVDPHPKFEFLQSLSMIHARDVINFDIIEGVEKIFAGDHFELDKN